MDGLTVLLLTTIVIIPILLVIMTMFRGNTKVINNHQINTPSGDVIDSDIIKIKNSIIPDEQNNEVDTINLTEIKGIGVKRAEWLKKIGINSIEDLANSSAETLSTEMGCSSRLVSNWIEEAKRISW